MIDRLILGTAQFGMDYGVTNRDGTPPPREVDRILAYCREVGITSVDTSRLYGTSEEVIGANPGSTRLRVCTKVRNTDPVGTLEDVRVSLAALRRESVETVLVHNVECYQSNPLMFRGLEQAKRERLCRKIGFSVYSGEQLDYVAANPNCDVVQLPLNALDKRALPAIARAQAKGIEIHTRSAFLQGLLADPGFALPRPLAPLVPARARFFAWARTLDLSPVAAALLLPLQQPTVDKVVVGVATLAQLRAIVGELTSRDEETLRDVEWPDFAAPEPLLNPANWTR